MLFGENYKFMTEKMNKIQIRAEVFSSINDICNRVENSENVLYNSVNKLSVIEDKDFLAKLLIKEFISTDDSKRGSAISLLLIKCVPVDILENNLWSNLALKTVSDSKKYQLVDLLKSMGKFIDYDKYLDYFEEPQNVIDIDTRKLLSEALLNPESQIDFLDFLETLSKRDKTLLIQSMVEDYTKDDLANILAPIVLYEKDKEILNLIIKELINSKSPLVYYPFKRYSELSKDEEMVRIVNKGLKELKIAGVTQERADEYYKERFKNSLLYSCYTGLVDGRGNQGLIFSRIRTDNTVQMFCVVINDKYGIVDSFGFNTISGMEFSLIVQKFSESDKPLSITFETGLSWLEEAEEISYLKNNKLPYEYICWKEILYDVSKNNLKSDDFICDALKILPAKQCDLTELFAANYLDKLFFTKDDNENFKSFIMEIDNLLSAQKDINLNLLEEKIKDNLDKVFDEDTTKTMVKRLERIAFIFMSNSNNDIASKIYELSKNKELQKEFFKEILKKSIFVFYEEDFKSRFDKNADNIFIKNAKKDSSKLDNSKVQELLEKILSDWGNDG